MKTTIRAAALLASTILVVTACGTGTESTGSGGGGDSRNVALVGDDGLPYQGISAPVPLIGIDPASRGVWLGGYSVRSGAVTGGGALLQAPGYSSLDPTFPRIGGRVNDVNYNSATGEVVLAGDLRSIGTQRVNGLGVVTPNGVREIPVTFNGQIYSMARVSRDLYVAGNSTYAVTNDNTFHQLTFGLHRVNLDTGRLLQMPAIEGMRAGMSISAIAPGRLVADNSRMMAVVIRDPSLVNPYSLHIVNVLTGAIVKTLAQGKSFISLQSAEAGYALVQIRGEVLRLLSVDTGIFSGTYAPPNPDSSSAWAGEGRIRVLETNAAGVWRLVDLSPRTLAPLATVQVPSPNFGWAYVAWAGADRTLIGSNMFIHATRAWIPLASSLYAVPNVVASIGQRGLFLGGDFDILAGNDQGGLVRVPDDGSVEGAAGLGADQRFVSAISSTRHGVVAVVEETRIVLLGRDASTPATVIGTITRRNDCAHRQFDVEPTEAGTVLVSGCWTSVTVGGTTVFEDIIEIDLSSGSPVLRNRYRSSFGSPTDVASTSKHLFVISQAPDQLLAVYRRDNGALVLTRRYWYRPDDIAAFEREDPFFGPTTVMIGVGSTIQELNAPNDRAGSILMHRFPTERPGDMTIFPFDDGLNLDGGASAIVVRDVAPTQGRPRQLTVFVGGDFRLGGQSMSAIGLDFSRDTILPVDMKVDGPVTDIAIDDDRLWLSGRFLSLTSGGRSYRTSVIAGYDLTANAVLQRGRIPLATTTTVAPPAVSGSEDLPIAEPLGPTPPPDLPTSGDAPAGTYSVVSASGARSEVQVLPDGTVNIAPVGAVAAPNRPFITRLKPGSRNIRVSFTRLDGSYTYKVTTGRGKAKRTCSTSRSWCTVKNLDPWKAHVFVVEAIRGRTRSLSDPSPFVKPNVKVKKGSSTRAASIVPQAKKGKAKWTTASPCAVRAGRLVAPKKIAQCPLKVTVGTSTRVVRVQVG